MQHQCGGLTIICWEIMIISIKLNRWQKRSLSKCKCFKFKSKEFAIKPLSKEKKQQYKVLTEINN